MNNFDDTSRGKIKEPNPNWPQVSDHLCRILIIGDSRPRKANVLINLISHQPGNGNFFYMLRIHMKQNTNW